MSLTITPQVTGQEASSSITYCYLYEPLRIDVDESVSSSGIRVFIDLEVIDSSNTSSVIETLVDYGEFDVNPGKTLSIDLMKIVRQHHDSNLYKFSNIDDIVNSGWDSIVSKYIYNFKIRSSVSPTPIEIKKLPIIGGRTFQDFKPAVNFTNKISLIQNGTFEDASVWIRDSSDWQINSGASFINSSDLITDRMYQHTVGLTSGVSLKVRFKVSNFSGTGTLRLIYPFIKEITGDGIYEVEGVGGSVERIQFDATADDLGDPLIASIDSVSLYTIQASIDDDFLDEISKQEIDMYSKWNGLQLINIDLANLTSSSTDKSPTITKVVNSNTNGDFCGGQVVWKSRLGGWCTWAFQLKRERQDKSYGGGFDVDMFEATNGSAYIPVNYTSIETSYSISLKDLSLGSNELRAVQSIEASPAVYYMPNSDGRLELMRLGSSSAPIFNMANGGDFSVTLNSISKNFQKTK